VHSSHLGCSNLLVGAKASGTGSPQIAYTSDAGFQYGGTGHYPAGRHPAGTMRPIYNEDSGTYAGQIPEAPETYNAIAYHGGMNEHQLAISETTFGGLSILGGQKGLIDYGTLMDLALQRCKTAREAITFIDQILKDHGYASSGESISIADTKEVWLMELVSKGAGEKGAVWVARRVPDDGVCSHANQARIRTWPRDDPENAMFANDTVSFAVSKGLFPAHADPLTFSFSDVYDPVDFTGARLGEARAYNMLKEVSKDASFAPNYLDYAQGYNLTNRMPLFVTAEAGSVTLNTTSWLMRTRFTGTWFDERSDVGAGPYHAEYRARPLLWSSGGKKYLNERTVGVQQNAFHFVANPRANVPAALGGILWNGCDDQSLSVRFPIYTVSTELAPTWVESAESNRTVFKMRSSHWAFNLVANFAYFQWSAVAPVVQGKIVAYEEMLFKNVAEKDTAVLAMIKNGGASKEDVAKTLTEFSVQAGDKLVDDWNTFFGELFVRFSDGFDASVMPRAAAPGAPTGYARGGTSTVQVKEPGYDQSWYDRIAADAGEKYHVPGGGDGGGDGDAAPLLNPRLSKDRLRFM